jgi:hypothetical protein
VFALDQNIPIPILGRARSMPYAEAPFRQEWTLRSRTSPSHQSLLKASIYCSTVECVAQVPQIWLPKPLRSHTTDLRVRLIRMTRFIGPRRSTYGMTAKTVAVNSACSGFSPCHSTNW